MRPWSFTRRAGRQQIARLRLVRRLTRALDVPMAALSLVFLGVVIADVAAPPEAPYRPWLDGASLTIWGAFVLEFAAKLAIAPDRGTFIRRSWFDLLVLAVPMLRILRALRAFRALRAARALRLVSLFRLGSATRRGARALSQFLRASRFGYVSAVTGVVVVVSAVAMVFLERDAPGAQIHTLRDALWWSASTVTTVGGDLQPVTDGGRVLSVAMMLYAMIVFGYLVSRAVVFIQAPVPALEAKAGASDSPEAR